jgi:hypothetical protein
MVSNSLRMDLEDLLATVRRMREQYAGTAEYEKLRRELPEKWPL